MAVTFDPFSWFVSLFTKPVVPLSPGQTQAPSPVVATVDVPDPSNSEETDPTDYPETNSHNIQLVKMAQPSALHAAVAPLHQFPSLDGSAGSLNIYGMDGTSPATMTRAQRLIQPDPVSAPSSETDATEEAINPVRRGYPVIQPYQPQMGVSIARGQVTTANDDPSVQVVKKVFG